MAINSVEDETWSCVYDHSSLWERFLATCSDEEKSFASFSPKQIMETFHQWLEELASETKHKIRKQAVDHGFIATLWNLAGKVIFILDGPEVSILGIGDKGIQDGDVVSSVQNGSSYCFEGITRHTRYQSSTKRPSPRDWNQLRYPVDDNLERVSNSGNND
ncbi:hypothetical protein ASPWEDRAFT_31512 [Aspergillus wentii DTO 134E9]|uniref:Uncharacterized protein n=1 Tax=Aspergillus wentii DTO 134E9 TaxID=1073089 RepID=A0A1L9R7F3_ASPWE|nr:uncharacterized protein ASPWEDRAFT_31512 [Aspergillus wentii DTO 134E9]OJJ30803.1 hypothetical protein ASPWEDRAFT_31512 [Aspergillus wentii DTO 134E9]